MHAAPASVDVTAVLSRISFFEPLQAHDLAALVAQGDRVCLNAGETVFSEGEEGECLYVLLAGEAEVLAWDADGELVPVARMEPGDFFGEIALLDGCPRSATVTCRSDVELFLLDRSTFFEVVGDKPAVLSRVLIELGQRLRETNERYLRAVVRRRRMESGSSFSSLEARVETAMGLGRAMATPLGVARTALSIIRTSADALSREVDSGEGSRALQEMMGAIAVLGDHIDQARGLSMRLVAEAEEMLDEDEEDDLGAE